MGIGERSPLTRIKTMVLDITGQRFTDLIAIGRAPSMGGRTQWIFECVCGAKVLKKTANVTSGNAKSCGCRRERHIKLDLTGQRFERLLVLKEVPKNKHGHSMWECMCDCGEKTITSGGGLSSGHAKSCGCIQKEKASATTKDLTGQRFGRWTVLGKGIGDKNRGAAWDCRCDCGNEKKAIRGDQLKRGKSRSCGCLNRESAAKQALKNFTEDTLKAFAEDAKYASRKSLIYLVEVGGVVDKIGIAFNMVSRRSRGRYTQTWWQRKMTRAQCWAVEQVGLQLTQEWQAPNPFTGIGGSGPTEQRTGWVLEDIIQMMEELCDECIEMGWEAFYEKWMQSAELAA